MLKTVTCILCPNSCEIQGDWNGADLFDIQGNLCKKGAEYILRELQHPTRNFASSVLVTDGELPLCSVRLTKPIPKERIFDVMQEIKKLRLTAPVKRGQVVIPNILGLGADLIATKTVLRVF